MNNQMHKRAVGIVVKDKKILLIHRFNSKWQPGGWYYVFPGGGVEDGETTQQATLREIKEELSIDAKIDKLLFVLHNPIKMRQFDGRDEYFYLITKFSGEVKLGGPEKERMDENDQFILEWVPIEEMKNMPNLHPKEAKEKLISLLFFSVILGTGDAV